MIYPASLHKDGCGFRKIKARPELLGNCAILVPDFGGDLASTGVAKPEVHAEVQNTS